MISLDARRKEIESRLAAAEAAPARVRFHPGMAETYRDRVDALIRGLGQDDHMDEAREALRGLVDRIVLSPKADGPGVEIDLHGALASLLRLATGVAAQRAVGARANGPKRRTSAGADFQDTDIVDELVLVAGVGFEPTTFRL